MAVTSPTNTDALVKDMWGTDPRVVRALEDELGFLFDVDVCGTPVTRRAPEVIAEPCWWRVHPHIDMWTFDWWRLGRFGFMNPPFSQKDRACARAEHMARRHGMTIVGMLPHSPTTNWYRDMEFGVSRILMPDVRIQYIHPISNRLIKQVSFETTVALWEPRRTMAYERISLRGIQA